MSVRKVLPAPQIIRGQEFTVRDSHELLKAYVNLQDNVMVVPMDDTPQARLVRAHETSHVCITPLDGWNRASKLIRNNVTLQSVEDARVWANCRLAGVETNVRLLDDKTLQKCLQGNVSQGLSPRVSGGLLYVTTYGVADNERVAELLETADPVLLADVQALMRKYWGDALDADNLPSFESGVKLGQALESLLYDKDRSEAGQAPGGDPEPNGERAEGAGGEGQPGEGQPGEGQSGDNQQGGIPPTAAPDISTSSLIRPNPLGHNATAAGGADREGNFHSNIPELVRDYLSTQYRAGNGSFENASSFKVENPPLTNRLKGFGSVGKGTRYDVRGMSPKRMSRYVTSGRIFAQPSHSGSATVLVDISGSMGLTQRAVISVLEAFPRATVAAYSGTKHGHGRLVIIAKNGKSLAFRDLAEIRTGAENVCDLQAIEWLARQRGPRFWISDGRITGMRKPVMSANSGRVISAGGVAFVSIDDATRLVRIAKRFAIRRYATLGIFKLEHGIPMADEREASKAKAKRAILGKEAVGK